MTRIDQLPTISDHGPVSYRSPDKRDKQIFPYPVYLIPPLSGFPLESFNAGWSQMYRRVEKFDDTCVL